MSEEKAMETGKTLTELTEEQVKEWMAATQKKVQQKEIKRGPVITISREWGSGGSKVAYLLKDKFGKPWQVWDKEILDEIQKNTEVNREVIESLDEKSKSAFENFVDNIFAGTGRYFGIDDYRVNLVKVISRIGHFGYAVILGRGANFILPDAFRVRIVASRRKRVDVMEKYEEVSESEALLLMRRSDHEREDFVQRYFNSNINDPWNYDLCVKTSYLSPEAIAEMITLGVKEKFQF